MAKAELLVLPNELLHLICTKLCSHCRLAGLGDFVKDEDVLLQAKDDKEALCNLSLTSRRLRDIAQPILYHTLHIHSLDPRGLHKRVRCSQIHLSDCVKSATIDHDESRVYTNNDTISLKSLAVSFNLGHIKFCPYSRLKLSLLELLLAQIRNVEFLDLTINYRNHKDAFAALRHPDIEGNPMTILSSLQGLRLRSYRMRNHFTPEMVQGLFVAAPNLTHLHLDQCTGPVPRNMHLGTVRHLKISDAYFQQPDIQNLLASCENLESFKITGPDQGGWDQGGWNQFMRDAIKPKDVVEALSSHRDSLRELYMRLSTSSLDRSFWENATIKSLTDFTTLQFLTLDTCCIFHDVHNLDSDDSDVEIEDADLNVLTDLLPSSLKSFRLIDDPVVAELNRNLERLADAIQSGSRTYPELRDIQRLIVSVYRPPGISPHVVQRFEEIGVGCNEVVVSRGELFEQFLEESNVNYV